jgi:hypothetical protein
MFELKNKKSIIEERLRVRKGLPQDNRTGGSPSKNTINTITTTTVMTDFSPISHRGPVYNNGDRPAIQIKDFLSYSLSPRAT